MRYLLEGLQQSGGLKHRAQVQRYMGYVVEELAEENQIVRGCIIALEDDLKLKRALKVAPNIDFYRYQVNFKLFRGDG